MHNDNERALPQTLATRLHIAGHSSTSSHGRRKDCRITPPNSSYQRGTWYKRPPRATTLLVSLCSSHWELSQLSSLRSPCLHCIDAARCTLPIVSPEGYSSVRRGRQEGKILGVPSALNHFILVLSHHHDGKLFSEVSL